jgi:hypothetical protein
VGALNREKMLSDRPRIEQADEAVFSREGFIVKRVPAITPAGDGGLATEALPVNRATSKSI